MSQPSKLPRFAGDITNLSRRTKSALRRAVLNPLASAEEFPHKLRINHWKYSEDCRATIAEVAYVRWNDIARSIELPYQATNLAWMLHSRGYDSIAFDIDDSSAIELLSEVLSTASMMTLYRCLDCRVYLVPSVLWFPSCADAIYADIEAETAHLRRGDAIRAEWSYNAERAWLRSQMLESLSQ